jgi:uncharacterized protein (TIGR01777 family)
MKVLVTGATGLVGEELVKLFLQNGISINYLTTSKSKIIHKLNYNGFYWNPLLGEIDVKAFENVDVIIHLAGASVSNRWTKEYKKEIIDSRMLTVRLLYNSLTTIEHQVKQIVSASAIGIYPDSFTKIYHEDDHEVDNSFLGKVVYDWENEVNVFEKLDIKVAKIRIGLVLASNGGALQEIKKPIKLGIGSPFGSGKQYQSWIHVLDLAYVFLFAVANELSGTFNAVSPYPVTNEELTKAIAKKLAKPLFVPNIPKFLMKFILGEMHIILFSSQNASSKKLLDNGFQFKYAALDKALQNLL